MKNVILMSLAMVLFFTSCYEDYKEDFYNTASYFAYQYPVRSLKIDRESETMSFKVGVTMGGKYSYNDSKETVTFSIEDSLINNNQDYLDAGIRVMPEDWYTLSHSYQFTLENSNIGQVEVVIDRDKFIANKDAASNTYAIPFVLTGTSCDSILDGKNYSVVCVKYMNEYDGRYYVKGQDNAMNIDGSVASTEIYSDEALVKNQYVFLETIDQDMVEIARIGGKENGREFVYNMQIRPSDGAATLMKGEGSVVTSLVGASTYDQAERSFVSTYNYTFNGVEHSVTDTLIYYNEEMELEMWQ